MIKTYSTNISVRNTTLKTLSRLKKIEKCETYDELVNKLVWSHSQLMKKLRK